MKTIDLFCASPASTAICSSMDHRSIIRHGTRPIDHGHHHHKQQQHHHHHLRDRKNRALVPCSSQPPFDPKPNYYQTSRNSTSSKQSEVRRKSSADILDLSSQPPGSSSRHLLSDTPFIGSDHFSALVHKSQSVRPQLLLSTNDSPANSKSSKTGSNYSPALKSSSTSSYDSPLMESSSTHSRPCNQVVELRVSIHCKGCEGKVRKHISRMEGVISFSIDLATKKVTVVGDVTPLGVLTSVSRVKNAEFWPSPTSSSWSPMAGLRH
ncbi:unnamed protein product [Ilex paraguariensis]|uniref:HMA domain-containing protein n=1 Tax=Ilex paraguariensis TaxID=185542 RepID=A0ABC8TKS2_9AQUA